MKPITLKPGQSLTFDGEVLAEILSVGNGSVRLRLNDGQEIEAEEGDRFAVKRPRKRKPRLEMSAPTPYTPF